MVKPWSEEALTEGGGSYLTIEKTMKMKKKRKTPPPEEDVSNMVASNVDPFLLVRVPHDNRVNVDGVLDDKMQKVVAEWEQNSSSLAAEGSCGGMMGNSVIEVEKVAPKTAYVVAFCSETDVETQGAGGVRTQVVSKSPPVTPVTRSHVEGGSIRVGLDAPQSVDAVQMAPQPGKDFVVNSGTGDVMIGVGGGKSQNVPALHALAGLRGSSTDGLHNAPFAGKGLVFMAGGSGSGSVTKAAGSSVRGQSLLVLGCNARGRHSRVVLVQDLVPVLLPSAPIRPPPINPP
ncbi:hypothetical protein LIER_42481 [Lithospermum erythrorhizon]|uniref:Uncharacterized protein n=1 Tax=Lithospermum erythrorhizon TaxID=34254 RepID=A0AAV3RR18_LITER